MDTSNFYIYLDTAPNYPLEILPVSRAMFTVYTDGIFIHQGKSYRVLEVDMEHEVAKVRETTDTYITTCRDFTDVDPIEAKMKNEGAEWGEVKGH